MRESKSFPQKRFLLQKGFSLIEVIISVAVLAIIGVLALQIFTASISASEKTKNIDVASSKALIVIEMFKSDNIIPHIICYDENWNETEESVEQARFVLYAEHDEDSVKYTDTIKSFEYKKDVGTNIYYAESGKISKINVFVVDNEIANYDKKILISYTATTYVQGF